jgi:hypothetical protein
LLALKLSALILLEHTNFHATSCARCLEECIAGAEYWDVHLESQPPDHMRDRILNFLAAHARAEVHAERWHERGPREHTSRTGRGVIMGATTQGAGRA